MAKFVKHIEVELIIDPAAEYSFAEAVEMWTDIGNYDPSIALWERRVTNYGVVLQPYVYKAEWDDAVDGHWSYSKGFIKGSDLVKALSEHGYEPADDT